MAFGQPGQHQHMVQGKLKAAQSAKTPRHLKEHLIKQANATKRPPMGVTGSSVKPARGMNPKNPPPDTWDKPNTAGGKAQYERKAKNFSPIYG